MRRSQALLQLGEEAGKAGELNNRRDAEITLPAPLPSASGNLKPREDPCPKFFNTLPSQEDGAGSFYPLCQRENHSTVRQRNGRHVSRSRDPQPGLPARLMLCLQPQCQTLGRTVWEWSSRLGSPSLSLKRWKGSACGEAPVFSLTFCRAREGAGPEAAGELGKPLQPSRALAPRVMLSLPTQRGRGVG